MYIHTCTTVYNATNLNHNQRVMSPNPKKWSYVPCPIADRPQHCSGFAIWREGMQPAAATAAQAMLTSRGFNGNIIELNGDFPACHVWLLECNVEKTWTKKNNKPSSQMVSQKVPILDGFLLGLDGLLHYLSSKKRNTIPKHHLMGPKTHSSTIRCHKSKNTKMII